MLRKNDGSREPIAVSQRFGFPRAGRAGTFQPP